LPIWLFRSQISKFWLLLEIKNIQTKSCYLQLERLGSGKTLPELHIHYKSFLTRVYDHAGCTEYCKDSTVAVKTTDGIDKK